MPLLQHNANSLGSNHTQQSNMMGNSPKDTKSLQIHKAASMSEFATYANQQYATAAAQNQGSINVM